MAHHSSTPFDELAVSPAKRDDSLLRELAQAKRELGATGRFPEGKLVDADEGEIMLDIIRANDKIVVEFGKPLAWVGFTPTQAREVALMLTGKAHEIDGR